MDYSQFNKQVYFKFKEKFGTNEFASLILLNCGFSTENRILNIPQDWSSLLTAQKVCSGKEVIPNYLGMIAIQVGIAFLRKDQDDYTATAFNYPLEDYLQYKPKYETGQEEIFERFEAWCRKNGLYVYLPEKKTGTGRYVQFPISLALLNGEDQEDLKRCFNSCGFPAYGDKDEVTFWRELRDLPDRIKRKKAKFERSNADLLNDLKKQIYFIYLRWDGSYAESNRTSTKRRSYRIGERSSFVMEFDCDQDNPSVSFLKNGVLLDALPDEINNGNFFVQDEYFAAEWSMTRPQNIDLKSSVSCAYVCKGKNSVADSIQEVLDCKNIYRFDELIILILSSEQITELSSVYPLLFGKTPTIRLVGGIKLPSEDMPCWMNGAGPLMVPQNFSQEQDCVWLEEISNTAKAPHEIRISEQGLISLSPGKYCIRFSAEYPAILFKIENFDRNSLCAGGGWLYEGNTFRVCDDSRKPDICGLDFSTLPNNSLKESDPVRQWMGLAMDNTTPLSKNESVIHTALRRAKDGIRIRIRES